MKRFIGFECGMGIGGWLTNYKRFNVIPPDKRAMITIGDMEHFATYITESDIQYIKSLGMDHIRLGFDQIVLESSPYCYREEIFALLDNFIAWCKRAELNVVLNMHKAIGNYCDIHEEVTLFDSTELQDRFVALWLALEKRYSGESTVAFELLNEVRDIPPELWNSLAERTLKAIRAENQQRTVIIGSTCWNSCNKLDVLRLYDDENTVYTFHTYDPFEFTHQRGVLQQYTLLYNRAMPYPCEDIDRYRDYHRVVDGDDNSYPQFQRMDIEYIRYALAPAIEFTKKHPHKILWCGEFGTIRHADITSRENWMRDVISVLRENHIPYCVWNYLSTPNDGNRFSLVDDDTRKILSPELAKIIKGE